MNIITTKSYAPMTSMPLLFAWANTLLHIASFIDAVHIRPRTASFIPDTNAGMLLAVRSVLPTAKTNTMRK